MATSTDGYEVPVKDQPKRERCQECGGAGSRRAFCSRSTVDCEGCAGTGTVLVDEDEDQDPDGRNADHPQVTETEPKKGERR